MWLPLIGLLLGLIIYAGYGFYILLEHRQGLVEMGLISFVAVAQFLPGIFGVLYWPRATWQGFVCGLLAGIGFWVVSWYVPGFTAVTLLTVMTTLFAMVPFVGAAAVWLPTALWLFFISKQTSTRLSTSSVR